DGGRERRRPLFGIPATDLTAKKRKYPGRAGTIDNEKNKIEILKMKNITAYLSLLFCATVVLSGCSGEKAPPPPLTYTGEDPRVQDPLSPEDSQRHIQLPEG